MAEGEVEVAQKKQRRPRNEMPLVPGYAQRGTMQSITEKQCYQLAARGMFAYQIAWHLGVAPKSFYNHVMKHPELKTAMLKGRAKAIAHQSAKAFEMSQDNPIMLMFWLKAIAGWSDNPMYSKQQPHEVFEEFEEQVDEIDADIPSTGVVLLPADIPNADEWERQVSEHRKRLAAQMAQPSAPIDVTPTPPSSESGVGGTGG